MQKFHYSRLIIPFSIGRNFFRPPLSYILHFEELLFRPTVNTMVNLEIHLISKVSSNQFSSHSYTNLYVYIQTALGKRKTLLRTSPLKTMLSRLATEHKVQSLSFAQNAWNAIITALKYALNSERNSITIFTDSMSALSAIESTINLRKDNFLIIEIRSLLYRLWKMGKYILLVWIPGHFNIFRNEKADRLAKSAKISGTDTDINISLNKLKNYLKKLLSIHLMNGDLKTKITKVNFTWITLFPFRLSPGFIISY